MLTTLRQAQTAPNIWQIGCHTRTGKNHDICQDALKIQLHDDGSIAAALADGVSGGARGDVAADTAVAHLVQAPHAHDSALRYWLAQTDATVAQALSKLGPSPGACTAVAVWLNAQGQGWLTHLGDCRAYLYAPENGLQLLTQDHSYFNLGLAPPAGLPPTNPAYMFGLLNSPAPQITPCHLMTGQTLCLCSDGLHGEISHPQLEQALKLGLKQKIPLPKLAEYLAQQAIDAGGEDDVAITLLHYSA